MSNFKRILEILNESSELSKLGFPKEFISAVYKSSNLDASSTPTKLSKKPTSLEELKDGVYLSKTADDNFYALRITEDGKKVFGFSYENGKMNDSVGLSIKDAVKFLKSGLYFKVEFKSYNKSRAAVDKDKSDNKSISSKNEILDYMNKVFLPKFKSDINEHLDYIYANLRKLSSKKDYYSLPTDQEQALQIAKNLEDISKNGFNNDSVSKFLVLNKQNIGGFGSFYKDASNFVAMMEEKPNAKAEFAKMLYTSIKTLRTRVEEFVRKLN